MAAIGLSDQWVSWVIAYLYKSITIIGKKKKLLFVGTPFLCFCPREVGQLKVFFYSTPFWGRVYKWKFCLFVHLFICLSVITSYSFPSDSKLTQHPPVNLNHATSPTSYIWGRVMCQPDIFCICPDFLKKSTKILKKFHSLIPSVQCSLPCVGNNSQSRCSTLPSAENFPTHNLKHRLCTQKKINQQICVKFCTQWFFLVFVYLVFVLLEIVMSEISVTVYQVHNRP